MSQPWSHVLAEIIGDETAPRFRLRLQGQSMLPALQPGDELVVERSNLCMLRPGDLILVRQGGQPLVHRLLGIQWQAGERFLLTGGDHQRSADPLWPEEALMGRVVGAFRENRELELPVGRSHAWRHRARIAFWSMGRRLRNLFPALLLLSAVAFGWSAVWAAVTLVTFEAKWIEDGVRLTWETATEVDNLGFYLQRSQQEDSSYERITGLIPSEGDIAGAFYEWTDSDVVPGEAYYYRLEDISASGATTFWGPVSVGTEEATPTQTHTATPTRTPTSTPSTTPSPTPTPSATVTPTPSASPTWTPTPTLSPTSTPTRANSPTPSPVVRASATPSRISTRRAPSPIPSLAPTSTFAPAPVANAPESTMTFTPSPLAVASATASLTALPSPTALPSFTPIPPESIAAHSADKETIAEADSVSEQELLQAKRRLTWSLIGIAGVILGGLCAIVLAVVTFALYRWGFLRRG